MACNLINAAKDTKKCKVSMAGVGDRVFFFDKDEWLDLIAAAAKNDTNTDITTGTLPEPGKFGMYTLDAEGEKNDENIAKFALLQNLLVYADIKTDSGQVTSEKAAENETSSQVGTFVVTDNVDDFNELAHALAFANFGAFIPVVGHAGRYYVVMSPYKKTTLESNYDSGTTYDSDHGFTVTLNASPCEYGVTFFEADDDLKTWCKE